VHKVLKRGVMHFTLTSSRLPVFENKNVNVDNNVNINQIQISQMSLT